jgi:photosystem II stability/assembly factor-like uncharacterized protein
MTSTNSQYLSVSSGHVDDLINYVLDVKPYHTKLSQIVEEFLFTDAVDVKVIGKHDILTFLGPDIMSAVSPATGVRARRSKSWERDEISDGVRRVFPVPLTIVPKKLSHLSQEKFVCGTDDNTQIVGLSRGAFNQQRWDFSGVDTVLKNGDPLSEGIDYHLSYGVFSFRTTVNQQWKPLNVSDLASVPGLSDDNLPDRFDDSFALKFSEQPGKLMYLDVIRSYGSIVNITDGNYEEWTLTCVEEDIPVVEVRGSESGVIGTATQGIPFVHALISFEFQKTPGESVETISLGQTFTLTPFGRVVVHPDAPNEVWSLIKTNPQSLVTAPVYTRGGQVLQHPGIQVHTREMDRLPPSTWSIVVGLNNKYVLDVVTEVGHTPITGYPKTVDLLDGCSYKDDNIHFTLLPTANGFYPGDRIDFTVKSYIENFLVYGSVSGWQAPAQIGNYYWNGKIGFKIPELKYFAKSYNATIITSADAENGSWTTVVSNPQILNSVSHVNGSFIVSGEESIVGRSLDGYAWSSDLTGLVNTGELYVVIGDGGKIVTSTNGTQWMARNSHTNQDLKAVAHIPDLLTPTPYPGSTPNSINSIIVVGNRGTILTSINGVGWLARDAGTQDNLNDIAWSNDGIFAVGTNGTIIKSMDRVTWTPVSVDLFEFPGGIPHDLNAITYEANSNIFIVVGANGTVLKSTDGGNTWIRPAQRPSLCHCDHGC